MSVDSPTGHRRRGVRGDPRVPLQEQPRRQGAGPTSALVLIVIWGLAPFYWMVVTAFRDVGYTFDTTPWPTHVTLDNFTTALRTDRGNHFGRALVNSVGHRRGHHGRGHGRRRLRRLRAGPAATSRASTLVLGVILGASMFPGVALVTPLFQLFSNLGWLNGANYQALIIPNISFALPLTVYTLTAFFSEMPWELEESARIDGCTPGAGVPQDHAAARRARAVHHRDPGVHRVLERVPARPAVLHRQDPAGHRRHRQLHRRPAAPGALHRRHGGRHHRHRAADHHGAALPAARSSPASRPEA